MPESHKKDYFNFKRRVLEKAHKDIHKHTSLKYEWEPIKRGRSVAGIRFVFAQKRAAPIVEQKKTVEVEKTSKTNNDAMKKAIECHSRYKNMQKKCIPNQGKVCAICLKFVSFSQK